MSDSKTRLRWGILGCARISRRGLIPGIQGSSSSTIQAIASRDRSVAKAWAQEFGAPKSYGSYEELLACADVDAVYIPLPNELHKSWTCAAADAGKHVLCEKPLAIDSDEAKVMVDHCRARGVVLVEAFMWRHQPRTAAVRKLVADGAIGDLRLIRPSFSFPIDMSDWRLDPARGGGALWDVGCYGVSTARLFAGAEPTTIRSMAHMSESGVDLSLTAELAFPNGKIGLIDCSFEQPFRCSYELVGTRGAIEVPDAYLPPERPIAWLIAPDGSRRDLAFDGYNQYSAMVDSFAAAVAQGGRLLDPTEDGLSQMCALDAVVRAAVHV
jgi:D-xylose 1-dehydrogenase (NADP+, D-xylono-1,5-lactone-forming)